MGPLDTCHDKIDLFGVQNIVIHQLSWWKYCQADQPVKLLTEWLPIFWLFWYQIWCSRSNRTNFTQVWRPKNCQFFLTLKRSIFSWHVSLFIHQWSVHALLLFGTLGLSIQYILKCFVTCNYSLCYEMERCVNFSKGDGGDV